MSKTSKITDYPLLQEGITVQVMRDNIPWKLLTRCLRMYFWVFRRFVFFVLCILI